MILILLVSLVMLSVISFVLSNGDIISPWFLSCIPFAFSSFVVLMNPNWYGISAYTVIVIITGLIAFGIGDQCGGLIFKRKIYLKSSNDYDNIKGPIVIPYWFVIMICISSIPVLIKTYNRLYILAELAGYTSQSQASIFTYGQYAIRHMEYQSDIVLSVVQYLYIGVGYVFSYVFIYNIMFSKIKLKYFTYLLGLIPFIFIGIFTTSRTWLFGYIVTIGIIWICLRKIKYDWNLKSSFKVVICVFIALVLFFFVFYKLGNLTGKSTIYKASDSFSLYAGSSIVTLDQFLSGTIKRSNIFGEESLVGIYQLLYRIGFNLPNLKRVSLPYIHFSDNIRDVGNTYTVFRRYIYDFGYVGMLVIEFFNGAFASAFYSIVKNKRIGSLLFILYGYYAYNIIFQFIEDQLLSTFLSITPTFTVAFICIVYYFVRKMNMKRKNKMTN